MFDSTTYAILLSPKYRALRYTFLGLALLLFAFSETSYHYSHMEKIPFVILLANAFLCKAIVVIIYMSILIPLLLKKRYTIFWLSVFVVIFALIWIQQIVIEDLLCKYFGLYFWKEHINFWYVFIDILAQNALWFLFTLGIIMGRVLKYWSEEFEHKQQIQSSRLQMETESMKKQVSPVLLCKTLRRSGELALTNPKETSDILIQLSRLLRYQLYDCRHEKVLLDSEIQFLNKYLTILKYNDDCCSFNISVTGQTMGILIPPLLFVPFLQFENESGKQPDIDIKFLIQDNWLTFEMALSHPLALKPNNRATRNELSVRHRLERLYPLKHSLTVEDKHVLLLIQIL